MFATHISKQCLHVGHCCANDAEIDLISKCFIPLKLHQSAQSWIMNPCVLDVPKQTHIAEKEKCLCGGIYFFFASTVTKEGSRAKLFTALSIWSFLLWVACGLLCRCGCIPECTEIRSDHVSKVGMFVSPPVLCDCVGHTEGPPSGVTETTKSHIKRGNGSFYTWNTFEQILYACNTNGVPTDCGCTLCWLMSAPTGWESELERHTCLHVWDSL